MNIGIVGYGNLGKNIEAQAIKSGVGITAIFSRRKITSVFGTKTESLANILSYTDKLDVMMLCGGSATDLPIAMPKIAAHFNLVDCYDNHSQIQNYRNTANELLIKGSRVGVVSSGWDPGLFSVIRLLCRAVMPASPIHTFWGKGVSQGHSEAIRRINGVKRAVQYTVPVKDAIELVKSTGGECSLSPYQMHARQCYVVAHKGADLDRIRDEIVSMPDYFLHYETDVSFISEQEFLEQHMSMPHGGRVLASSKTETGIQHMEFSLELADNPAFTAGIALAYARACHTLYNEGQRGAFTVYDIPLRYLVDDDMYRYL